MEKRFAIFSICVAIVMGVFAVLYPKTVKEYIIKDYKNNPFKWSNSSTWMESKYGDVIFRVVGVVFLLLSLLTFYNFIF